jgi:hypothetical protein
MIKTMQNPYCKYCWNSLYITLEKSYCNKCRVEYYLTSDQKICHNNNILAGIACSPVLPLTPREQEMFNNRYELFPDGEHSINQYKPTYDSHDELIMYKAPTEIKNRLIKVMREVNHPEMIMEKYETIEYKPEIPYIVLDTISPIGHNPAEYYNFTLKMFTLKLTQDEFDQDLKKRGFYIKDKKWIK